jgi:hypothetical protein
VQEIHDVLYKLDHELVQDDDLEIVGEALEVFRTYIED